MDRDIPATKVCTCCAKRKPARAFGKNLRMKSGLKSYCKMCSARLQREWRESVAGGKPKRKRSASRGSVLA